MESMNNKWNTSTTKIKCNTHHLTALLWSRTNTVEAHDQQQATIPNINPNSRCILTAVSLLQIFAANDACHHCRYKYWEFSHRHKCSWQLPECWQSFAMFTEHLPICCTESWLLINYQNYSWLFMQIFTLLTTHITN